MTYSHCTSLGRQARIKAGRRAFYDQKESWENPYELASLSWYDWWDGWRAAHNEFVHPDFHIPSGEPT